MSVDVPRLLDALGISGRDHGDEIWGPCPHPKHRETRPSWSIANKPHEVNNGAHYCFGCQFTGGPIDLVVAVIGLSRPGAKQWIQDRGLWMKGSLPLAVTFQVTNRYSAGLKIPRGLISGPVRKWATPVRRYAQARGLTDYQAERWDLCYAIDGDMAGRIVIPLKDERNKWLSWHGRTYSNQDKRYKNASNADGYDPGAVFGLRHWPELEARASAVLVLTEGSLDALACERAGADYIVAIGGSDPHARQTLKLSPWGRILVATDGDDAGDKLYLTIRHAIGARCDVRRVAIPRGKDAAQLDAGELWDLLCLANTRKKEAGTRSPVPNPSRSAAGSAAHPVRSGTRRRRVS